MLRPFIYLRNMNTAFFHISFSQISLLFSKFFILSFSSQLIWGSMFHDSCRGFWNWWLEKLSFFALFSYNSALKIFESSLLESDLIIHELLKSTNFISMYIFQWLLRKKIGLLFLSFLFFLPSSCNLSFLVKMILMQFFNSWVHFSGS